MSAKPLPGAVICRKNGIHRLIKNQFRKILSFLEEIVNGFGGFP
jgi:hypothetical protein